jgi:PAS domain S-box-containing protein
VKFIKSGQFKEVAVVGMIVLTAWGFLEDLRTKQGVDDWVCYFVALTLSIFINRRPLPFSLAGVFTALTLLGFYFSPPGSEGDTAFVNCLMGVGVLWVTATIIYYRQRMERNLCKSELQYQDLFKNMHAGLAHCRMIYEDEKPADFIYLSVNPAFSQITGLNGVVGKRVTEVIPGIKALHPELFEIYGKVAREGKPRRFEYHLETSKVWLSVSAYSPAKGYFVTTFENITERKLAENSSSLFRALMDRSSDGIDIVDPETGCFHDVNETTCRQLGYTRAEMLAKRVADVETVVRPEIWPLLVGDLRQRRSLVIEGGLRRKDGTTFPVEVNLRWVELDREYIVAIVRDITERKQAQDIVQKSQEQLLSLVKQAPISIAMFDREMRYIITSDRWISENAPKESNLMGRSHYDVCPDLPEAWKAVHKRALAGELVKSDEDLWVKADGSKVWLRWAVHPWWDEQGKIGGVMISTENITERRIIEEALLKQRQQSIALGEQVPVSIAMFDREMRYLITSRQWAVEYGRGHENLTGLSYYDLDPAMPDDWKEVHRRALAGEFQKNDEDKWTKADGRVAWVRWKAQPWMDTNGQIGGIIISAENITERKMAEDAVRQSEDRLRMVTENARVGLVMVDRERRYTYANSAYFEILGLPPGDMIGRRVADVLAPLYEEQVRPQLDRAFAGERVTYELHKPNHDGNHIYAVKYEPMKTDNVVTRVVVVITDITEQKRANESIQKQLDELQRWHGVMIGREERILGLKREVNELLISQRKSRRYSEISTV